MINLFTKLYIKSSLLLSDLKKDEKGVTAIEYALVAASLGMIISVAMAGDGPNSLKGTIETLFKNVATSVNSTDS